MSCASMVDVRFTMSRSGTPRPEAARRGHNWRKPDRHGMGPRMERPTDKASRAGGAIIALTVLAGAVAGSRMGQPSLGVVIGAGAGIMISLALYLYDRRRG